MDKKALANQKHYDGFNRTNISFKWPLWYKSNLLYEDSILGDLEGKKVLDVGGGIGRDSYRFKSRGAKVTMVDISSKNLEAVPFECEKICDNAEELSKIKNNEYDVVFCRALLHHLSNPSKALRQMKNKLVAGGQIIFVEPLEKNFLLNIGRLWRNKYDNRFEDQNPFLIKECELFTKELNLKNVKLKPFHGHFLVIIEGVLKALRKFVGLELGFVLYGLYLDFIHYLDDLIIYYEPEQARIVVVSGEK